MSNPRRIGTKNQREVARFLSRWTGWDFHSTPRSGGLHWKRDARVVGDIVCDVSHIDEFPFTVEAKRRASKVSKKSKLVRDQVNLGDLLLKWTGSKLWVYWMQAVKDAYGVKKFPMMFIRNSGMPKGVFYVFLPYEVGRIFEIKCGDLGIMYIESLSLAITTSNELSQFRSGCMAAFRTLSKMIKDRKSWYEEVVGYYLPSEDDN